MATGYTIVNRALRICRVLDATDTASGAQAEDALNILNALLAEWHEAEIGLPDYSLATLETEFGGDAADQEAVAYALAKRLCSEYGQELMPQAQQTANETEARLRLRYFQASRAETDLPKQGGYFDFNTGGY